MTRQEYMNICYKNQNQAHSDYYSQFVDSRVKEVVLSVLSIDHIRSSGDFHFNDIPLTQWDTIAFQLEGLCKDSLMDKGDFTSLATLVCVAKEAARQMRGF